MSGRVAVVGMGVASAYGLGVDALWRGICSGSRALSLKPRWVPGAPSVPVGELPASDTDLAQELGLDYDSTTPRTVLLGLAALREALRGIELPDVAPLRLISASTVGGMCHTERYFGDFLQGNGDVVQHFTHHSLGSCTRRMCELAGISARATTLSTACSSGANAILLAARVIAQGQAQLVVAGGADALSRFTLNGFGSLRILSPSFCRPFDRDRDGINLGEAAAYLVLEAEGYTGKPPLGYVSGWANANDAFHQTALSPEGTGPHLAMTRALDQAGIPAERLNYVNAHGTGTEVNDRVELEGLDRILGAHPVPLSSTKGYTGHTLAAAGALEAVISILALREAHAPAGIGLENPISAGMQHPSREGLPLRPDGYVLSNSFGFGGNCTSLIFQGI